MDLEEALAQADVYSNGETEEYCTLESDTSRVVVIPDRYKTFGVEGDNRAERIKFKFPKVVGDNIDLSSLNLRINYQNAQGGLDKYIVETVLETDDDHVFFTWLIQDGVTPKSGPIYFVVQAVKVTSNGNVEKKWSTALNKIGQVLEGLEVDEMIEQQNPDIIEQILVRLDELEENGGGGGTPGKDGVGISNIAKTGTAGLVDTYTITLTNNTTYTFTVKNGENGDPGQNGTTPTIGENGNWYLGETDTGKPSRGEKGDPGDPGPAGDSGIIARQEMQNTNTNVTLEPNKLYVFPKMASLTVTLAEPDNSNVANEYHFFFTSGETATMLTLNDVLSDAYSIEANMKYEVSILEGVAYIKGVAMVAA